MNLLLTNDDGFDSVGIKVLANRLSKEHNVFIVAPSSNRSAVSHCITMFHPLTIKKEGENVWSCSGYPSDCVVTALKSSLLDKKIDAVISGINIGSNLGTDIVYSGTCAAARQGVFYGVPSIALSLEPTNWTLDDIKNKRADKLKFDALADFVAKNLEKLISLSKTNHPRIFVNVNAASLDVYKGVKISTELSVREYKDSVKLEEDSEFSCKSTFCTEGTETKKTCKNDFGICQDEFISISQVFADPMCADLVDCIEFSL